MCMLEFNGITIDSINLFNKYLKSANLKSSNYSFVNLYMWRNYSNIKYAILNDALIIMKTEPGEGTFFNQPIGYNKDNLKFIIDAMLEIRDEFSMKYFIKDGEAAFTEDIKSIYPDTFTIEEDRDCSDYIYESSKLASLSGKNLRKKKNHYNNFIKSYNYEVKIITSYIISDCMEASTNWFERYALNCDEDDCLQCENQAIHDVLLNFNELKVQGIAVYVNEKMEAFTIGERVNNEMAIIHIEKANHSINGLYSFINKTFIEMYYKNVKYINREEDLGIAGLRKAKLSYRPCKIEMRYILY